MNVMSRVVFAALAVSLLVSGSARSVLAADKDSFAIGDEVPRFSLKAVNPDDAGKKLVGVDDYFEGSKDGAKKAILISFFATYCEPCKREMPFLAALYDEYREQGLMVLSVSIDKEADKVAFIKELATKSGVKFPVLSDRFNIVAKRYMISKLPCVYLLGPDGKVTMVKVGYDDNATKEILDNTRTLLGIPTTDPVPEILVAHMGNGHASDAHAKADTAAGAADAALADEPCAKGKEGRKCRKAKKAAAKKAKKEAAKAARAAKKAKREAAKAAKAAKREAAKAAKKNP
ncbi:redoxin domain-containing protein [Myxococcota bacterium]|nr:redoxin domain-containing protein [Myxococcota bacterium]